MLCRNASTAYTDFYIQNGNRTPGLRQLLEQEISLRAPVLHTLALLLPSCDAGHALENMADSELATRAPENDAMEDLVIPRDPVAQSGASIGDHCTTDRPTSQTATGQMSKFGEIDVYISKPQGYPQTPARLLLLLTGGTGVHSPNNQIQADKYASHGYLVIMPDQFSGDAAPNTASVEIKANPDPPLLERIKLGVAETAKSFMLDMWVSSLV
jgi:hypothetical protein